MKKIFTNGCFYFITPGHIQLFKDIKNIFKKDCLIVGVNSSESIYRLKKRKPIIDDIDRIEMIKSIKYVDDAFIFNEDTPYELIKKIKPDVIVKGADYNHNDIVGSDIVKYTITINHYKSYSTTDIISKLKDIK